MNNINHISLVGRVGGEPEILTFESGSVLAKVSLAVDRNSKDEEPNWFEIKFWGNIAKVAADYVHKGNLIGVEGEIQLEEWESKTGDYRYKLVINANRLELLGSKTSSKPSPVPASQTITRDRIPAGIVF